MSDSILLTGQVFPQMLWKVETGGSLGLSDFLPSRGKANNPVSKGNTENGTGGHTCSLLTCACTDGTRHPSTQANTLK